MLSDFKINKVIGKVHTVGQPIHSNVRFLPAWRQLERCADAVGVAGSTGKKSSNSMGVPALTRWRRGPATDFFFVVPRFGPLNTGSPQELSTVCE